MMNDSNYWVGTYVSPSSPDKSTIHQASKFLGFRQIKVANSLAILDNFCLYLQMKYKEYGEKA